MRLKKITTSILFSTITFGLLIQSPNVIAKTNLTKKQIEACQDGWMVAHRKEVGDDAIITFDQLEEWKAWCKKGKMPPK